MGTSHRHMIIKQVLSSENWAWPSLHVRIVYAFSTVGVANTQTRTSLAESKQHSRRRLATMLLRFAIFAALALAARAQQPKPLGNSEPQMSVEGGSLNLRVAEGKDILFRRGATSISAFKVFPRPRMPCPIGMPLMSHAQKWKTFFLQPALNPRGSRS